MLLSTSLFSEDKNSIAQNEGIETSCDHWEPKELCVPRSWRNGIDGSNKKCLATP